MMKKSLLILAGFMSVMGAASVHAEAPVYQLNPIVVTANREKAEELHTPAATEVITSKEIRQTGAATVHEALRFGTGIITQAQGPRNISQGTMVNKSIIRGVEKGTLVLVDGVPINQGGRYNLESISAETVDRIEVVRGGGAVLYGSEATGGVINIITKGKRDNLVRAGLGNYGIQNYVVSAQADKLGITYTYDKTGKVNHISSPEGGRPKGMYYNIKNAEHSNVNWRYQFNKNAYFTHTYDKDRSHYVYRWDGRPYTSKGKTYAGQNAGKDYKHAIHELEDNMFQFHYDTDDFKSVVYYHRKDMETTNHTNKQKPYTAKKYDPSNTTRESSSYFEETMGLDVSNRWHFDKGSFMVGFDFQRDLQDNHTKTGKTYHYDRNMYSFYGQLAYDFTDKTRANLNLRETWTDEDQAGNSYSKFTPELVLMHDLSENTMLYAKAGKSFMMPTFNQLYGGGSIVGVPGLKPQEGDNYEIGVKKDIGDKDSLRLALFRYKIKDSIDATSDNDFETFYYKNEDVRNTGVELEWNHRQSENLTWHAGLSYSHPEKQESESSTKGENTHGRWHDYYGRVGFNAGVTWIEGKLTTSFNTSVLGNRTRDYSPYPSMKSQWFTDLNFSYKPNDTSRFFLNIDNLFDRKDIVSSSSSSFYSLGINFMAGYEYKF